MKRLFHDYRSRCLWALTVFCVGASLLPAVWGWAEESPGLSLSIYADQNQYLLGDPIEIKLIAVIKRNIENEPIYTERGFSKVELHRALRITDPGGITHTLEEGPGAHIMPPPFSWKEKDWALAESLAGDFVLSETVHDLKTLLPKMKTTAGWYTIEVRQPFIRFAHTATHSKLGLLGVLDDLENWHGTINSNKIQVFISPGLGAHLQVQVLDTSSQPMEPLAQVPVRVFDKADIPAAYELKDAWLNIKPVLIGTTDFKGWATWDSGAQCMQEPEVEYTAIAYYSSEYKKATFEVGDAGWEPDCSGLIKRQILFGYLPRTFKVKVVDDLNGLLEKADKKKRKEIEMAIQSINESLKADLWIDDSHLSKNGYKVFDEEKKAVKALMEVKGLDISHLIVSLVEVDERLAQTAIDKAIEVGGDQKEIKKAQDEMVKAHDSIDDGEFDNAIDHYKKAWEHSQNALKP